MKEKFTFQQKTKLLTKLFDAGCNTEKKLQQLDMESILKIPGITIPDMSLIIELQKQTKVNKLLPSTDMQMSLISNSQAEEQKSSAFSFSQEIIDAVLTRGSGISEGKMRIYEQFEKSLSAKENADFLKNEYGWGVSLR